MTHSDLLRHSIRLLLEQSLNEDVPPIVVDGRQHPWPEIVKSLLVKPKTPGTGMYELWVAAMLIGGPLRKSDFYESRLGGQNNPWDVQDDEGRKYEVKALVDNKFRAGGDSVDATLDMLRSIHDVVYLLKSILDDETAMALLKKQDPSLPADLRKFLVGESGVEYRNSNYAHFRRGNLAKKRLQALQSYMTRVRDASLWALRETNKSRDAWDVDESIVSVGDEKFQVSRDQLRLIRKIVVMELTKHLDEVVDSPAFKDPESWLERHMRDVMPSAVFKGLDALILVDVDGYYAIPVDDDIDNRIKYDSTSASRAQFIFVKR